VILRFHFHVLSLAIIFIKDITYTAMHASCSDLYLEINSEGRVLNPNDPYLLMIGSV
jgi:hypothetical protein